MAGSQGNWCRKLMDKRKRYILKQVYGSEQRFAVRAGVEEIQAPKERKYLAPKRDGYMVRGFKRERPIRVLNTAV